LIEVIDELCTAFGVFVCVLLFLDDLLCMWVGACGGVDFFDVDGVDCGELIVVDEVSVVVVGVVGCLVVVGGVGFGVFVVGGELYLVEFVDCFEYLVV